MIDRLTSASQSLIERRTSRRGFLSRLALVGSAMAVAPLRYLLQPTTAWAVIRPQDCDEEDLCREGFTEFCCSIYGGRNQCPEDTYIGGWWKCTHYPGSKLCGPQGIRYYLDCNERPGGTYPGGCQCAEGDCRRRRVACNVFRYGQCNTQVDSVGAIVCRIVVCTNPATIPGFNCNHTYMQDNETCRHESGCLERDKVRIFGPSPGA